MASVLARHALRRLPVAKRANLVQCRRTIHSSPIALKRKSKAAVEDFFDDAEELDDLIPIDPSAPKPTKTSQASTSTPIVEEAPAAKEMQPRKSLTPEARLVRFDALYEHVSQRIGKRPVVKRARMRHSAWTHLIGLATTEEQLTRISELFPQWHDGGHEFHARTSEQFIRRCEELNCPLLALKVFGDYAKYTVRLTLPGARQLLHSLHMEHPIETVMTASALYGVYELPSIADDLPSCAMFVSACLKHNSPESLLVADAMKGRLRELLEETKEGKMKVSPDPLERNKDKSKVWVMWSLKKVDKALYKRKGKREDWLKVWREANGHIKEGKTW